jgi:hypothetical protein
MNSMYNQLEVDAGVVPFKIGDKTFEKTFVLVDGIYPSYSRFVKGIKLPITNQEKNFTGWQERARKDIERAFGAMKATWQFVAKPIMLHDLATINNRITICMILHNVLTSDRVMGEPGKTYDPCFFIMEDNNLEIEQPNDLLEIQAPFNHKYAQIEIEMNDPMHAHPDSLVEVVTRKERWISLTDKVEHARLHDALLAKFGRA